jgi:hypothetical protein
VFVLGNEIVTLFPFRPIASWGTGGGGGAEAVARVNVIVPSVFS